MYHDGYRLPSRRMAPELMLRDPVPDREDDLVADRAAALDG